MEGQASADYVAFFDAGERQLRLALTGAFGVEIGRDAAADALTWAWQNWDQVEALDNPMGYLYRVGRSSALRSIDAGHRVTEVDLTDALPAAWELPDYEPDLAVGFAELSESQRVSVWMVHGLGFTYREVAELLGCSRSTVAIHVRRGLAKLRHRLGVTSDA